MDHFEEAHDAFIKAHLRKRRGSAKAAWHAATGRPRSCFAVMSGGRFKGIFPGCIRSLKCWIGADFPTTATLLT